MSHIENKTPRSTVISAGSPGKPASPSKSATSKATSPRLEQKSGNPKDSFFSPSAKQAGCIPLGSPRKGKAQPLADSPYKSPSSKTDATESGASTSLRAYLNGLNSNNLVNVIFRDQTTANAGNYPTAWTTRVKASAEKIVQALLELESAVLGAMPEKDINLLYPAVGQEENFNWKPFGDLCASLWPKFARQVISLKALPQVTLGLLAEFHDELAQLPAFPMLAPEERDKVLSDALFNILIWNGIFSPLIKTYPDQYQRLVYGLCAYVKIAWGVKEQSQGDIGSSIGSMVQADHAKACAKFRTALAEEVKRLSAPRTVKFEHDQHNHRLDDLREKNLDRYFADTWLNRNDDYEKLFKDGNYFLTRANGARHKCKSYEAFCDYVGTGSKNSLPQVVLHLAGMRIKNYLCNTYLYGCEKPLFTDTQGQRVDPVPNLQTKFIVSRNAEGRVTVKFSCSDHAVNAAMLIAHDELGTGVEATPLFQASLEFHGKFHFYPKDEEFEAGNLVVMGQNLHMFQ